MGLITSIQLNTKGYIEVTDDVAVPLTFSVAEVQDISKRLGAFSKTITVPGTPNNNKILGQLFDVNITDSTFDINKREQCTILQRGVPIIEGYMQLKSITKISPTEETPDQICRYDLNIQDDSASFFNGLSDSLLEDLTGWSTYDHRYTLSSITATSAYTWNNGYKYHLMYNLKDEYNLKDFTPNIFAKVYWDKIFGEAGYSYTWTGLTQTYFDKMVIPYAGDVPKGDTSNINFRAGFQGTPVRSSSYYLPLLYNDDVTTPNADLGGNFDTSTSIYTSPVNGPMTFKMKYRWNVYLSSPNNARLFGNVTGPIGAVVEQPSQFEVQLTQHIGYLGTPFTDLPMMGGISGGYYAQYFSPIYTPPSLVSDVGRFVVTGGVDTFITSGTTPELSAVISLTIAQKIQTWVETKLTPNAEWRNNAGTLIPPGHPDYPVIKVEYNFAPIDYTLDYFMGISSGVLDEGYRINMSDFVPRKVKQREFISGVVKLYNLYITPDKDRENHLIVETRDEYYSNGKVIDWTNIFVNDNDSKLEFLPDIQNKKLKLTYKADNDPYNESYLTQTSEIYGQAEYTFQSEFVKDTKTIETIFSPTPLDSNGTGLIVPTIPSRGPKNNIRILYDAGWIANNAPIGSANTWTYRANESSAVTSATTVFTTYPYAGHFNNPTKPSIDFNYALTDFLFYDTWENVTQNGLYERHWRRQLMQIADGKLLTAKFRLDEKDILNLDLRDTIWIHDTRWYINKIIDYNSNSKDGLTTVELINAEDSPAYVPYVAPITGTPITQGNTSQAPTTLGTQNDYSRTTMAVDNTWGRNTAYNEIQGYNNTIQPNSKQNLIIGLNNNVAGSQNIVLGNSNTLQGSNVIALGVSGLDIKDSNQFIIGGSMINYVNFIDAGTDEVLNPFNMIKLVNLIDAGTDAVQDLGSQSLENLIDGGEDKV